METGRAPQLVLRRSTAEQAAQAAAEDLEAKAQVLRDAAGFTSVFEMMRACGKPAVGHNLMFDLSYSLSSFADAMLPVT